MVFRLNVWNMSRRSKDTKTEWIDPYEFLVKVKKEPTLSVLALADLDLSDQTISSTSTALDNYLSNVFEAIKDKLVSITTPPPEATEESNDTNHHSIIHSHNKQNNNNPFRPIISKDDLNLTFNKIKLDIVSHTTDLLNDRFRSDRCTLLNYKKKIAEQIETNRNAAQEFRKDYDISARNRHEESIRVLQQYEAEKYTEETTRLRNIIKDLEHSQSALLKKLSGMEEEKVKLSKAVADSNAATLKISSELKAIKDAKRKQNRGNESYKLSVPEPEVPSSPSNSPGTPERRSSMASRSSKEFNNLGSQNTPPSTPSSPLAKHMPQICQKCVVYEEDIKNLKTILIQLTNVNANMQIKPLINEVVPQTLSSTSAVSIDLSLEIDDSRPTTAMPTDITTATATTLPASNVEQIAILTTAEEEKSQQAKPETSNEVQVDEAIVQSTTNNAIIPIKTNEEDTVDITNYSQNMPIVTDLIPDERVTSIPTVVIPDESVTSIHPITEVAPVQSESPIIKSKVSAITKDQPTSDKNVDVQPKSKDKKKSKQPQITKAQEIPMLPLEAPGQGAYQGFGPTSKDLKNINKVMQESPNPKKYNIIDRESSIASAESEMIRPSSSMSDYYGLRPSTTLSDMSRDDRITEDMYDLAKGRGLLSHEALQKINRKNENLIQEYQTKMLSLEYQIRNLSKRIRSDEAFMERLDYLNALKLQERDILLTAICNQLKRMREAKESENRLKNFSKAEMPLQMPKQLIQSKKTLPLPNIKFDIPPERKSSPQSDNNKLVLSNSMPNLPHSRYLESLQPTSNDKIIVSSNQPSSSINSNSLNILEEKFRPNSNENQNKVRPRLPITDELYGDEGIEKLLKSDPDALYEYRNIRKQILNLVVEHTQSKPKKKAMDISLRKPFHL